MACDGVVVSLAQRMVPERDRHGTIAVHADPVIGGEAGGVDVSAIVEEQVHQIGAPRMHRVMQGAPPQVVAGVRGGRLRRQPLPHQLGVARLDRVMDRVAGSRGSCPRAELLAQIGGHLLVSPIQRHLQQRVVAVQRVAVGQVGAGLHQHVYGLRMPFAHGEMERRHVPEIGVYQSRIGLDRGP